jgi:hypothetical protein
VRSKGFKAQMRPENPQKANAAVHLLFSPSVHFPEPELPFCPALPAPFPLLEIR